MLKKRKYIVLIVLIMCLPLLQLIGKSSWIIIDQMETPIQTEYIPFQTDSLQEVVYNGQKQTIVVDDTDQDFDSELCTYTYYHEDDLLTSLGSDGVIHAGNYKVIVSYEGKQIDVVDFRIKPKELHIQALNHTITYGDLPANVGVQYSGFVEGENESVLNGQLQYTYDYHQYDNVGEYHIIPNGFTNSNYHIIYDNGILTVNQKIITISWDNLEQLVYSGNDLKPSVTLEGVYNNECNAIVEVQKENMTEWQTQAIHAGAYVAKVSLEGDKAPNYQLLENTNESFTIQKAPFSVSWKDYTTPIVYDGSYKTLSLDKTLPEGLDAVYSYIHSNGAVSTDGAKDAGTYTVIATITDTYEDYIINNNDTSGAVLETTLVIDTKDISSAEIVLNEKVYIYTGAPITPSIIVNLDNSILDESNYTITYTDNTNAGIATIQVNGKNNYSGTISTTFQIIENNPDGPYRVVFYDTDGTTILEEMIVSSGESVTPPTYQVTSDFEFNREFAWLNMETSEEMTSFDQITTNLNIIAQVTETRRSYNLSIWYKDKDNQVSSVKKNSSAAVGTYSEQVYDFVNKIGETTHSNVLYGSDISLSRQIRLAETYTYNTNATTTANRYINCFYMSPVDLFDWETLSNGSNSDMLVYVDGDNITIVVLCVQPQAIVSTDVIANSTNLNDTAHTYYANMNDAFEACKNVSGTTYLRIYGQARYAGNTLAYHCFTANTAINQYAMTVNNHMFTVPKYTLDISGYTLNTFTDVASQKYTINSNLNVILPYGREDDTAVGYITQQESAAAISSGYIQSIMTIPEGVTLEINGQMTIGGYVYSTGGFTNSHAVVMNEGTIIVNAGTTLTTMGYLKGTGQVIVNKDGTLTDIFKIYDWPGGANAMGLNNKKIFPFNCYSFHNVSCETKIYYGATYKAWAQLYMANSWATAQYITLVGAGGLFELIDGYVIKNVEDTTKITNINSSITTSNQDITQRDILDIYGSFKDNTVSVTAKVLFSTTITTNTDLAMPIGFTRITLKEGTGNLTKNSYKFLPGSSLEICEGAELILNNGVKLMLYEEYPDDYSISGATDSIRYSKQHSAIYNADNSVKEGYQSSVMVNGKLTVYGYLAGTVKATSNTGSITLTNNTLTLDELISLKYSSTGSTATVSSRTYYARGYIVGSGSDLAQFTAGKTYQAVSFNGSFGWIATDNEVTIRYDANGGILTDSEQQGPYATGIGGYTISTIDVSHPTREHYTFAGWYMDKEGIIPALGQTIFIDTILYAKWKPIEYDINYVFDYFNCVDNQDINNPNVNTYNVEDIFNLLIPTSASNYVFGGWYADPEHTQRVTAIQGALYGEEITLYGLWYPAGTETYLIQYETNNPDYHIDSEEIISTATSTYQTPNLADRNDDITYPQYFVGWFTDENCTQAYSGTIDGNMTLYAKWEQKLVVRIDLSDEVTPIEVSYIQPTEGLTIELNKYNPVKEGYRFDQWVVTGATVSGTTVDLPNENGIEVSITATYIKQYKVTIEGDTNYIKVENADGVVANGSIVDEGSSLTVTSTDSKTTATITIGSKITNVSESGSQTVIVTGDVKVVATRKSGCFAKGTPILLSDGTYRNIEDISVGDKILTFNHETGKTEEQIVTYIPYHSINVYQVLELEFENGKRIKVLYAHGFMNAQTRKYEEISYSNVSMMVGNEYVFLNEQGQLTTSKLKSYAIYDEITECYSISSSYNLNHIVNGALCISDDIQGLYNYFELDENFKYDEVLKEQDIQKYGLLSYDEVADFMTREIYELFNVKYLSVSIGKGLITRDIMMAYIKQFA